MAATFQDFQNALVAEVTHYRRDLHRIPALDDQLPQTLAYLHKALAELSCSLIEPCPSTLCAYFDCGRPETVAIRADMDALPIAEASGVPFASEHPGCMHACGHDGHMAMALATATWVDRVLHGKDGVPGADGASSADGVPHTGGEPNVGANANGESTGAAASNSVPAAARCPFSRNILFVFQPAEETTGGAERVCASGVFERYHVTRIFGMHLWPDLPAGQLATRPGPLLARSSETTLTFHGVSSHIAKWRDGRDALGAAARFVVGSKWLSRKLEQDEPFLLRFGHLEAGTVRNAIAGEARVEGSLRVFSDEMFARGKDEIRSLAQTAADEEGCSFDLTFSEGYPPVVNDEALTQAVAERLPELAQVPEPLLIAEDFAFYQRHLPGVFFLLGTGTGIPLHANTFAFDERVLAAGVAAYQRLVTMD